TRPARLSERLLWWCVPTQLAFVPDERSGKPAGDKEHDGEDPCVPWLHAVPLRSITYPSGGWAPNCPAPSASPTSEVMRATAAGFVCSIRQKRRCPGGGGEPHKRTAGGAKAARHLEPPAMRRGRPRAGVGAVHARRVPAPGRGWGGRSPRGAPRPRPERAPDV